MEKLHYPRRLIDPGWSVDLSMCGLMFCDSFTEIRDDVDCKNCLQKLSAPVVSPVKNTVTVEELVALQSLERAARKAYEVDQYGDDADVDAIFEEGIDEILDALTFLDDVRARQS